MSVNACGAAEVPEKQVGSEQHPKVPVAWLMRQEFLAKVL